MLRLLSPLRDTRLVDQDPESGHYRLGPQNALLGRLYLNASTPSASPDRPPA
ncbi:hypothetical protein IAG44_04090 [Streptomyces roseirectus]|uniref:Uncharacterized protein n=1 Tax=Streptomyces roseirectus TaxID=2768066 RepID=A0A7H0I7F3_9ACTN|nr:hypothetical protein [Streptomyces roseirectus]QNP68719.1 hypothetical protein IAG44_04090 [Streptomyces roseirectus]